MTRQNTKLIRRKAAIPWTEAEKGFLEENYGKLSYAEIAMALGKTTAQVKGAASRYGFTKPKESIWKPEEIDILRNHYADFTAKEISEMLPKRDIVQIYGQAKRLKLRKSDEFYASDKSGRNHLVTSGMAHRYPKGHVPFYKGKKVPKEKQSPATFFKKGNRPHNAMRVGDVAVTTDGYLRRKIAEPNKWEFVHRATWEAAHGPIPKGGCVVFKDGNKQNCSLENLELVTRAEHSRRNSITPLWAELRQSSCIGHAASLGHSEEVALDCENYSVGCLGCPLKKRKKE